MSDPEVHSDIKVTTVSHWIGRAMTAEHIVDQILQLCVRKQDAKQALVADEVYDVVLDMECRRNPLATREEVRTEFDLLLDSYRNKTVYRPSDPRCTR